MNYKEYEEIMKYVPVTESLRYKIAIMWLHPEILPVGVVSIGEAEGAVKIPGMAVNQYGKKVPVIAISREAFSGNEKITDIVLPASLTRLPRGSFSGCTGLKRITIPKKVKHIAEGVFTGCENLEDVYYEGSMEEWKQMEIVHEKHEIEFGDLIPGTPVQKTLSERLIHIPGNEALFKANIHFHCKLSDLDFNPEYCISIGGKDITDLFRIM